MTDDVIVKNEVLNDGRTVHLYYSEMYKEYVAYGFSAYIAKNVEPKLGVGARPYISYSKSMQMPMLCVNEDNLRSLQAQMVMLENNKKYICLQGEYRLDEEKYSKWASFIRG